MDASDVCREPTSSTRGIARTGLKKWVPMTWSGRPAAPASFMMRIEEVLEVRIASGSSTTLSRVAKKLR